MACGSFGRFRKRVRFLPEPPSPPAPTIDRFAGKFV